ncbi:MAG: ribosome biogenesis GTPase Der [Betaproteobacteria bacterium TMED41]|nr:MAG: ribosome biogenesis GTPase Der [Betaproteobacteria bacterium TMED41]
MLPIIVIVGRSNVGKSTLFNRLTRSKKAIVGDLPGLTRDRHFGEGNLGKFEYLIVDTGGFEPLSREALQNHMSRQTEEAIYEADIIIFLLDGKTGLVPGDVVISDFLRKSGRTVHLAVNKLEGKTSEAYYAEFFELGFRKPFAISAEHGDGVRVMIDCVLNVFYQGDKLNLQKEKKLRIKGLTTEKNEDEKIEKKEVKSIQLTIVGRPNVGKSTLFNNLLGEERAIAFDLPGTTRDAISVPFLWAQKNYDLIDTAGIRRRARRVEAIEKFSVIKAMQAIKHSNVAILLLDGTQDVSDQDAHIASFVANSGCALVVGINKWDNLSFDRRNEIKRLIERKLNFLSWARFHYFSALKGDGVGAIMKSVENAYESSIKSFSTPKLTKILRECVQRHPPPRRGLFRPKLRYAHQGGKNPPTIIIHGNNLKSLGSDYCRFLENNFRDVFKISGTPMKIEWKTSANPFSND